MRYELWRPGCSRQIVTAGKRALTQSKSVDILFREKYFAQT